MSTRDIALPGFESLEGRLLLSSGPVLDEAFAEALYGQFVLFAKDGLQKPPVNKPDKNPSSPSSRDDIGNTFADALAVQLDSFGSASLAAKIDYVWDVDVLSVVATQTGMMQVELVPLVNKKNTVSGSLGAYCDGSLIAQDAALSDVQATMSFNAVSGQTYFIQAASLDGGTGKYTLNISTSPAPDPEPPPPEPDPEPEPTPEPEPGPQPGDYQPGGEVSWLTEAADDGLRLVVLGTDGADAITVSRSGGDTVIITAGGMFTLVEAFASVQLYGFGGDDLLVSISGAAETIWGGSGLDSFWADSLDTVADGDGIETAAGTVHSVTQFYQPSTDPAQYVSLEIAGQDLVDPESRYAYENYSTNPLFADGPQYDDVVQGSLGDCYFMAVLSSLAQSDPGIIEQMVAPLGDGTYAVRFYRDGQEAYLRVDADLPTYYSNLAYGQLTPDGELWAAIAEKAYAFFRFGENSYASLSGGWMSAVYTEITNTLSGGANTATMSDPALAQYIVDNLEQGHAVSAGSASAATDPIVGNHAYVVQSIENVDGQWCVTVYNVWGRDGKDWDSNYYDGLLTLSLDMFRQSFPQMSVCLA